MRLRLVYSIAVILSATAIAGAQSAPAPARDSTKLALIRELLTMTRAVDQAVAGIETGLPAQKAANPRIPAIFWDRFLAEARKQRSELESMIAGVYERHLSTDDLRQLIAFYKTPVGQRMLNDLPVIMQESMLAGQEWGQKIGASVALQLANEGVRIPPR